MGLPLLIRWEWGHHRLARVVVSRPLVLKFNHVQNKVAPSAEQSGTKPRQKSEYNVRKREAAALRGLFVARCVHQMLEIVGHLLDRYDRNYPGRC
eukprot:SAG31_NODE_4571_length_3127_cov_2.761229_2_plen_95_part_00